MTTHTESPLTIRDHFALAALPALIERHEIANESCLEAAGFDDAKDTTACWDDPECWIEVVAAAYAIADAFLDARNKRGK